MPIQLLEGSDSKVLAIRVSGKPVKDDYADFASAFERPVRRHGRLRVPFDMSGFHGWDAGAAWEDTKFAINHFADIERIAMVGEKRWQHGLATCCMPFTEETVRYFDHADAAKAWEWLCEA